MSSISRAKQNPLHLCMIWECTKLASNYYSFQGKHWSLEQGSVHVLVHSFPLPSQHLQTIPRVAKILAYPANSNWQYIIRNLNDQEQFISYHKWRRETMNERSFIEFFLLCWGGMIESGLASATLLCVCDVKINVISRIRGSTEGLAVPISQYFWKDKCRVLINMTVGVFFIFEAYQKLDANYKKTRVKRATEASVQSKLQNS